MGYITGGGGVSLVVGDARWLKLDCTNDPLTADLDLDGLLIKYAAGVVMHESAVVPNPTIATEGTWWVRNDVPTVPMFTDDLGVDHNLLVGVGNNTLDQAYDQGGAGLGRTITASNGAVQMNNAVIDATHCLELNRTLGTGDALNIVAGNIGLTTLSRINVGAATEYITDDGANSITIVTSGNTHIQPGVGDYDFGAAGADFGTGTLADVGDITGIAGGSTLTGGTGAAAPLTLKSTTNIGKGNLVVVEILDMTVQLGDALGVNKLSILDSAPLEVAYIDSNGDTSIHDLGVGGAMTTSLAFGGFDITGADDLGCNSVTAVNDVSCATLTITGLIGTGTGLRLAEQAASPVTGAAQGSFWVKNDAPSAPYFTDDAGTDHNLLNVSAGPWELAAGVIYPDTYATDDVVIGANVMSGAERLRVVGDARVEGKLTVTGLIDPTGLKMDEQAGDPGATAAGEGTYWVKNDVPSSPYFTSDDGVSHSLVMDASSFLTADGLTPLTGNWDAGAFTITGTQLISDIAFGTAPLVVTSTTVVANLNVDQVDGVDLPGTIAAVLSDHNTAAHDALNIDAATLDGLDSLDFIKADGTVGLGAAWDVGAWGIRALTFESDVGLGTAPFTVTSTTVVPNLNVDQVDGLDLPNTTANILNDHNKALHDALNIDAETLDGLDSLAFVKANGTVPLTANWDMGAFTCTGTQFISDVLAPTPPLVVASATKVVNLNADLLDGKTITEILLVDGTQAMIGNLNMGASLVDNVEGVTMTEVAVDPGATAAGEGTFWVRSDAPSVPVFTDDAGIDHNLIAGAGGTTLDGSYDFGGAGAGRTITVDNGPVELIATATQNPVLYLNNTANNITVGKSVLSIAADYTNPIADGQAIDLTVSGSLNGGVSTYGSFFTNTATLNNAGEAVELYRAQMTGGTYTAFDHAYAFRAVMPGVYPAGTGMAGLHIDGDSRVLELCNNLYAMEATGDVLVTGKLTVTGLIDPTGIKMDEQAADPGATGAGEGTFWVKSDAPSTPYFTDDTGGNHNLLATGGGVFLDQGGGIAMAGNYKIATGSEAAPDVDAGGLCLNQGAADTNILSLKSSDVNQPFTLSGTVDSDTYGVIRKAYSTLGGVLMYGLSSAASGSNSGLHLAGFIASSAITGSGAVRITCAEAFGSGQQVIPDNERILTIYNWDQYKISVMGDGDINTEGGMLTGGNTSTPSKVTCGVAAGPGSIHMYGPTGTYTGLSIRNADVAHGMTDMADTNVAGSIISAGAAGGLILSGLTETTTGVSIRGDITTPSTTHTAAGLAAVMVTARGKSGTTATTLGSTANLFGIRNHTGTRFLVTGDGHVYADNVYTQYDLEDDIALLNAFNTHHMSTKAVRNKKTTIQGKNFAKLKSFGIVTENDEDETTMHSMQDLGKLHIGATLQMFKMIKAIAKKLGMTEAELKTIAQEVS